MVSMDFSGFMDEPILTHIFLDGLLGTNVSTRKISTKSTKYQNSKVQWAERGSDQIGILDPGISTKKCPPSRQFIATSAEVTRKGSLGSGNPTQNGLKSY